MLIRSCIPYGPATTRSLPILTVDIVCTADPRGHREEGKSLDPMTRRYLEACLVAPFSFYEIADCDAGVGFRARDLITGDVHDVLERSGSQTLQKGEVLFASLVHCDGIVTQHYDRWLEEKIPALSGKTPLQAVEDPDAREMVEALVSQIERDGLRMTPPLDASIPRRLRERLGLDSQ